MRRAARRTALLVLVPLFVAGVPAPGLAQAPGPERAPDLEGLGKILGGPLAVFDFRGSVEPLRDPLEARGRKERRLK